jgi:CheY-like chemotaxis protein
MIASPIPPPPSYCFTPPALLLAEDDENDVFLVKQSLAKAALPHRLIRVCNGEQCLDYLQGNSPFHERTVYPFPDLLILDLKMPCVSGSEVLEWLGNHPEHAKLPVIVLTGSPLPRDRAHALQNGAREVITKTWDAAQLTNELPSCVLRWTGASADAG